MPTKEPPALGDVISTRKLEKETKWPKQRVLDKLEAMKLAPTATIDGTSYYSRTDVGRAVAALKEEQRAAREKREKEEAPDLPALAAVVVFTGNISMPMRVVLRDEGLPTITLMFEQGVPQLLVGRRELEAVVRRGARFRIVWIDPDDVRRRITRASKSPKDRVERVN